MDYIVDAYIILNPYMKEYIHLERHRFKDVRLVDPIVSTIKHKYEENDAVLITVASSDDNAKNLLQHLFKQLAPMPAKSELN